MISSLRVIQKFSAMQKVNPGNPDEGTPDQIQQETEDVKEKTKALKELKKVKKDFQKAQKDVFDVKAAENPNDEPQELYEQVAPLLQDMGIQGMADRGRTQLVLGKTKGENSMYEITLRRNAVLTSETIARLDREDDSFDSMKWDSQAIKVYVWHPYQAPEQDVEAPGT